MLGLISRIKYHLSDRESPHHKIAVGFIVVSLFVFLGKLAGAAKEMAIAWRYGISETVDAYVFVFNLINLPVSIWFSVLTVVLIPLFATLRQQDPSGLPRFRGELLGLTLASGTGLGIISYYALPALLATGWLGLTDAALQQALTMAGPLSLLFPLGMVVALFSVWLMANGYHRNTLFEGLPAIVILVFLLVPTNWVSNPLIWGTLAGLIMQLIALAWSLASLGGVPRPILGFQSPAWKAFWGGSGAMVAAQSFMSLSLIIDQLFAAHLGTGAISTLSYANRIIAVILSLGALAISRSILPIFSEGIARGKMAETRRLADHWSNLMFLAGLIAMALFWGLASWVVGLLFQRGAFTINDTLAVSEVLRLLLLHLPFYYAGIVFYLAINSLKMWSALVLCALVGVMLKIVFLFLWAPIHVHTIAISTAVMYASWWLMLKIVIGSRLVSVSSMGARKKF